MDVTHKIIIGLIIVLLLILLYKKQENAGSVGSAAYSTEAVQNIAKVYSDTSGTATFNNINVNGKLNVIPKGLVSMWTGTTAPSGWALCDGGTYTAIDGTQLIAPDLRGRFVLGLNIDASGVNGNTSTDGAQSDINTGARVSYGSSRTIGTTGGEVLHKLTVAEIPTHNHKISAGRTGYGTSISQGDTYADGGASTNNAGDGKAHSIIPPYYVLAYIVKL